MDASETSGRFSVLMMYPVHEWADDQPETYFSHVIAADPVEAVNLARKEIAEANQWGEGEENDCPVLLVIPGHHDAVY